MPTAQLPDHAVNDVAALARAGGDVAERTVVGTVQGFHRATAARVFRAVPGSAPVQVVHDAVSDGVYGAVRLGVRTLGAGLGALAAARAGGREVRWLEADPARASALAIAHGIVGDQLAERHPDLDLPVRIRVGGRDVPPTVNALRASFPDATGRVAVFLHGLTESDRSWDAPRRDRREPAEVVAHAAEDGAAAVSGDAASTVEGADGHHAVVLPDVVADLGWTAVRLRYGTGRAVGRNGVELAELLETLVAAWPVEVEELALVGHSMGGLVIRSACAVGLAGEHRWPAAVGHVVYLGTPHLGSWLERAAHHGTVALRRLPEGAVVADVIDSRARGIKDLRHGTLDDDAWGPEVFGADGHGELDRPGLAGPTADGPLLDGAVHHLIAGRLTRSPRHPVTRLFGDLLVTPPSALGRDDARQLGGAQVEELELAAGHFRLMRDPRVADHLRTWLG